MPGLKGKEPGSGSKAKLSGAARWVLTSVLITNIGNGMHTITVSKLLYDQTGSAAAFGIVIIAEYVLNFLFQIIAGPVVDRGRPKRISVRTDLARGVFVCGATGVILFTPYVLVSVLASVVVVNMGKPFYRSATFAMGPAIAEDEALIKFNALSSSLLQTGQLIGVALVGPVIFYFGTGISFFIDGLSYLLAALLVALAWVKPEISKKPERGSSWVSWIINDWKEIAKLLRSNLALTCHILLCTGDFLVVGFVNLSLVPMVEQWYGGVIYWVSAFDGAFAIGAIVGAILSPLLIRGMGVRRSALFGLGVKTLFFALLAVLRMPYLAVAVMGGIGALNAISTSIFISTLQHRSHGAIKGRIAGVRQLVLSVSASLIIPVISAVQVMSLEIALLSCTAICALFFLAMLILGQRWALGKNLLGETASVPPRATTLAGKRVQRQARTTGSQVFNLSPVVAPALVALDKDEVAPKLSDSGDSRTERTLRFHLEQALQRVGADQTRTESNSGIFNLLGELFQNLGRDTDALDYYGRSLKTLSESEPNPAKQLMILSQMSAIYTRQQDYANGIPISLQGWQLSRQLGQTAEEFNFALNLAELYVLQTLYEEAHRFAECARYLAETYFPEQTQRRERTERILAKIQAHVAFAEALYAQGRQFQSEGNYERAINAYGRALKINPRLVKAYHNRAIAYKMRGEFERALEDNSKVIQLDPQDASSYFNRGNTYWCRRDYSSALTDYNEAIRLDPTDPDAYFNRGEVWRCLNRPTEAMADYRRAIALNQGHDEQGAERLRYLLARMSS